MQKIYYLTGNKNKFAEAKAILGDLEQLELDLKEIQEIDPKKIIEEKLNEALKHHKGPLIVEDVSFELEALKGLPGPFIKWFEKKIQARGVYRLAEKFGNINATVRTIVGLAKDGKIYFFEGKVKGKVVSPRGKNGFGFDVIFKPDGFTKTFAQMSPFEKNKISHRKIALDKLRIFFEK